ncbi:MAG: lactate oxidase, partial [Lacticaseibacillus paracasei]|nr:lactate oxidase [Lacticaseibacillus paracasei]
MVDAVETDPFGKVDAIDVLDLASLEARAEKILGHGEFGYISEGSDDGYTMRR